MADAPFLILSLYSDLRAWAARDHDGARAGMKKIDLHTEYLTGRSVILVLDSDKAALETKAAMVSALKEKNREVEIELGKPSTPRIYDNSKLEDFMDEESWLPFKVKRMCIIC